MEPIDQRIRELTRESPRLADELDEFVTPYRGEMNVWSALDEDADEDANEDEDNE